MQQSGAQDRALAELVRGGIDRGVDPALLREVVGFVRQHWLQLSTRAARREIKALDAAYGVYMQLAPRDDRRCALGRRQERHELDQVLEALWPGERESQRTPEVGDRPKWLSGWVTSEMGLVPDEKPADAKPADPEEAEAKAEAQAQAEAQRLAAEFGRCLGEDFGAAERLLRDVFGDSSHARPRGREAEGMVTAVWTRWYELKTAHAQTASSVAAQRMHSLADELAPVKEFIGLSKRVPALDSARDAVELIHDVMESMAGNRMKGLLILDIARKVLKDAGPERAAKFAPFLQLALAQLPATAPMPSGVQATFLGRLSLPAIRPISENKLLKSSMKTFDLITQAAATLQHGELSDLPDYKVEVLVQHLVEMACLTLTTEELWLALQQLDAVLDGFPSIDWPEVKSFRDLDTFMELCARLPGVGSDAQVRELLEVLDQSNVSDRHKGLLLRKLGEHLARLPADVREAALPTVEKAAKALDRAYRPLIQTFPIVDQAEQVATPAMVAALIDEMLTQDPPGAVRHTLVAKVAGRIGGFSEQHRRDGQALLQVAWLLVPDGYRPHPDEIGLELMAMSQVARTTVGWLATMSNEDVTPRAKAWLIQMVLGSMEQYPPDAILDIVPNVLTVSEALPEPSRPNLSFLGDVQSYLELWGPEAEALEWHEVHAKTSALALSTMSQGLKGAILGRIVARTAEASQEVRQFMGQVLTDVNAHLRPERQADLTAIHSDVAMTDYSGAESSEEDSEDASDMEVE